VGEVRCSILFLATLSLLGCQKANDMVLQPDTAAGVNGSAAGVGAAVGGTGSTAGSGAAGTTTSQAGTSAPQAGTSAQAGTGSGTAGTTSGGSAGQAGTTSGGSAGTAGGSGAAGSGATGAAGGTAGGGGGQAGAGGGDEPAGAQDADCDFSGIWIAKQVTVSQALQLPQSSNNWYYLEFKQSGTDVQVSKHFDCGIEVLGSATVTTSKPTMTALIAHNVQTGRKATLMKDGTTCKFAADRFWSIRGADEARFLPNTTRDSMDSIAMVAKAKPLPKTGATDGAVDTENDGQLGVAFQITGIATGSRNSVQRDWTRWFTDTGYTIPASTNWTSDLVIRADFDNEESVLNASNPLLSSPSTPQFDAKHVLKLRFLGRDKSDPRVAAIVKAADIDTCYAIQDAMPGEQLK
jgi:hypothetical protein